MLAALVVYLLVAVRILVVGFVLTLRPWVLALSIHIMRVAMLWHTTLVVSGVLPCLRGTPRHRLLLVVIHTQTAAVEAILQWQWAVRLWGASTGSVAPTVEAWTLAAGRQSLSGRIVPLVLLGIDLVLARFRDPTSLPLARGGSGGRRLHLLLRAHIRVRKASSHRLCLLDAHLVLLVLNKPFAMGILCRPTIMVVHSLSDLLLRLDGRYFSLVDLVMESVLILSVLLGVLSVTVLAVVFVH